MCGRYTLSTKAETLEARFHAVLPADVYEVTYNAAPSQEQLTIRNDKPHEITAASWGFVPAWADRRPDVKSVINARASPRHNILYISSELSRLDFSGKKAP